MDLPGRSLKIHLSLEPVDGGNCPAGLLSAGLQKRYPSCPGDSYIDQVIPYIDGIDLKGRCFAGTGLVSNRGLALGHLECPDLLYECAQP